MSDVFRADREGSPQLWFAARGIQGAGLWGCQLVLPFGPCFSAPIPTALGLPELQGEAHCCQQENRKMAVLLHVMNPLNICSWWAKDSEAYWPLVLNLGGGTGLSPELGYLLSVSWLFLEYLRKGGVFHSSL